jgi:hypothetical protein
MRVFLPIQGVPLAVPFALARAFDSPLWDGAFRPVTPGALTFRCDVLLFFAGGRA